jgi:flagellar basal-body rod protein FlgF
MVNGLYTATRGMSNILAKQDAHAQNLANATTTGFKLSRLVTRTEVAIGRNDKNQLHQDENQTLANRYTSFLQGPMVKTGNELDFALASPGFFAVESEDGTAYTRNGSFSMNSSGELVTLSGRRVLDENGSPILLRGEGSVQIMDDGGLFREGKSVARIGVAEFADNNQLVPAAEGLFKNPDPDRNPARAAASVGVKQGFLEGSNVDPIHAMVSMIAEFRNYEADQRAVQAIDSTLGKAVNEVGRV